MEKKFPFNSFEDETLGQASGYSVFIMAFNSFEDETKSFITVVAWCNSSFNSFEDETSRSRSYIPRYHFQLSIPLRMKL